MSPTENARIKSRLQQAAIDLREEKLTSGHPYMYFLDCLPGDQVIFEYPDGRLLVEQILGMSLPNNVIRSANADEVKVIQAKWRSSQ